MKVRLENPIQRTDWNQQLGRFQHHGIFHSAGWAAVLNGTYGFNPVYLTASEGDQLQSVLPLMEVNSFLTGRRGISLPFTDHCAPLGSDPEALEAVLKEAVAQGRARGWKYIETRGDVALSKCLGDGQPSISFYSHELELEPDADGLFGKFESSVRRAIRRSEKAGLTIEVSDAPAAVRDYYRLHCLTRRGHGLPPQPFRFFANIQKHLLAKGLGTVITARHQNRPVASAIFFRFNGEAIYKFGASDPDSLPLRANNLVMWEAIKWCAHQGARVLNFGRTSLSNEGLRRFKRGWGAMENQIQYYRYDLRRNAFVTETDGTTGWHTQLFQKLPIALGRLAGAALYRHIA